MKHLFALTLLALSYNVFALYACGEGSEGNDTSVHWYKITDVAIDSSLIELNGIICAGLNEQTGEYKKIVYKDSQGSFISASMNDLSKGIVLFSYNDLDSGTKKILKNADYISIKLDSTSYNKDKMKDYNLSLTFLRKFSKLSSADYKTLHITSSYWPSYGRTFAYNREVKFGFDELMISISPLPPAITNLTFTSSWNGMSKAINTKNL